MLKKVLDPCCGSRMFYFDRENPAVLFGDIRRETHELKDKSSRGGSRQLVIDPDLQMDFRSLPFGDASFNLVVFDPPHLIKSGSSGWLTKKYGRLSAETWQDDLRAGFSECFRVLAPNGTLIFKWNENDVLVSEILKLTPREPLLGHRSGKHMKTHWLVFFNGGQGND